jgi:polyribonucleotide nucleotidyltransferase
MFNIIKKEIQWHGRTLSIETGRVARQANGAVMVKYGETVVLCAATGKKEPKAGMDFFPLTVNYQEKTYAAGKIPGGFFKREGRGTEKETLTSRLIDRPIRPLFPAGYKNETQVICTVLAYEQENESDIIALIGASAALAISELPFLETIAGARVGYIDGKYVLNPANDQLEESQLDLIVAGTKDSVLMVESQASELSEEQMLGAVEFGHKEMQPVIDMINEMVKEGGKEKWEVKSDDYSDLYAKIKKFAEADVRKAYAIVGKQERTQALSDLRSAINEKFIDEETNENTVSKQIKELEKDVVRGNVFDGKRLDGRKTDVVRPILAEVGVLPKVHGSALFTRGETQALVVLTLGGGQDEQMIDGLDPTVKDRFMLHYNFPPYSVGEVGMLRGPGRREIGHGKLAKRSLAAILPSKEEFDYTLRIVSEITESNGSSSMATVCGSSLAMMDAGVPLSKAVAGIAMGLIKEGDKYEVLSDIMGDEDHLGDMDFKVAGTKDGITALQMDIKIQGITTEIMKKALEQAKGGRIHILGEMAKALTESRSELNPNAPKVLTLKIAEAKIREVIGQGGKVIKGICEESGAKVDIDDTGLIRIMAADQESADIALAIINEIVEEPEIGQTYTGKVDKITDYGAFVKFLGNSSGLIHISEFADKRIDSVTEIVSEGDEISFKVIGMDRGKLKLSYKAVNGGGDDSDADKKAPKEKSDSAKEDKPAPKKEAENKKPASKKPKKQEEKPAAPKKKKLFW